MSRKSLPALCLSIAMFVAGACWAADFQKGSDAYEKGDYATAHKEWTPLAEQGDVYAQFNLGNSYNNGQGVPQNYKTAVKWYTLAAAQGDVKAQYNLGLRYNKGQGVPQDYVVAHMWFNLSAAQGREGAAKNRSIVAGKMTPSQIAEAQKLARECVKKDYKNC